MKRRRLRTTGLLLLGLLGSLSCRSNGAETRASATTFETRFAGTPGTLPGAWIVGTSNPRSGSRHARWELLEDPDAPSPPSALALVDARGHVGQAFNLCWRPEPLLADVDLSVSVRAAGGREDQGGGPAWRIGGASDYYVARWNPLEDNFRVYSVVGGERLQLDSARVRVDPDAWHTIRVRHVGDSITCWLDGQELLHATDTELPSPGGVGLWTKADATTRFDDLVVEPADVRD